MSKGVTLIDPNRIDIRGELICGKEVSIDIGCVFEGKVTLGNNVQVKPYSIIKDSYIAENTTIEPFSYIDSSKVGPACRIGPYARLRPGSILEGSAHVAPAKTVSVPLHLAAMWQVRPRGILIIRYNFPHHVVTSAVRA